MALHIGIALTIEELRECLDAGMSLNQMADKLNRSQSTVRYWLHQYGLRTVIRPRKVRLCAHCNIAVPKLYNKFCKECAEKRVYKSKTLDEAQTPRLRKRLLIELRGHSCEECSLDTWNGQQIVLELHHDDGNSDNNDESNLKLLCPNCHSLTPTYRAANIGNGSRRSEYRKRRYHGNDE